MTYLYFLLISCLVCSSVSLSGAKEASPIQADKQDAGLMDHQLERMKRSVGITSMSISEMRDMIRHESEEFDELKNKSPYGKFYSSVKRSHEKCDNYCPNGTDYTHCGEECKVYFVNKTLISLQLSLETHITEFNDFTTEIKSELFNSNVKVNRRLANAEEELANQTMDIQKLENRLKVFRKEINSQDAKIIAITGIFTVFLVAIVVIFGLVLHITRAQLHSMSVQLRNQKEDMSNLAEQLKLKSCHLAKCSDDHLMEKEKVQDSRQDSSAKRNTMCEGPHTVTGHGEGQTQV